MTNKGFVEGISPNLLFHLKNREERKINELIRMFHTTNKTPSRQRGVIITRQSSLSLSFTPSAQSKADTANQFVRILTRAGVASDGCIGAINH